MSKLKRFHKMMKSSRFEKVVKSFLPKPKKKEEKKK